MLGDFEQLQQMGQDHHARLLRDVEKQRLANKARQHQQSLGSRRHISLRLSGRRLWTQRWRVIPVRLTIRRTTDSRPPQEFLQSGQ